MPNGKERARCVECDSGRIVWFRDTLNLSLWVLTKKHYHPRHVSCVCHNLLNCQFFSHMSVNVFKVVSPIGHKNKLQSHSRLCFLDLAEGVRPTKWAKKNVMKQCGVCPIAPSGVWLWPSVWLAMLCSLCRHLLSFVFFFTSFWLVLPLTFSGDLQPSALTRTHTYACTLKHRRIDTTFGWVCLLLVCNGKESANDQDMVSICKLSSSQILIV